MAARAVSDALEPVGPEGVELAAQEGLGRPISPDRTQERSLGRPLRVSPVYTPQVIVNAARQTPAYSLSIVSNTALFPAMLCAAGVKYHIPTTAEKRAMLKAVAPVYAKYEKNPQVRSFVTAIQKLKGNPKLRGGPTATDAPPASCLE